MLGLRRGVDFSTFALVDPGFLLEIASGVEDSH